MFVKSRFVEILQWAVANECDWDRSHCCGLAIVYERLKVLIWIKFKADDCFTILLRIGTEKVFGTEKVSFLI